MPTTLFQHINESATLIRSQLPDETQNSDAVIDAAVILGSGLGDFANQLYNAVEIPYTQIPYFHAAAVAGHAGKLVLGDLYTQDGGTIRLACMQGRFHYYEGHIMQTVTFPVRVLKHLGAKTLVVTNAAGGINPGFQPGSLMMISDHLNLTGDNPLKGLNPTDTHGNLLGPRFLDLTEAYDAEWRALLKEVAGAQNLKLEEGVYAALSGPTYETPAEIRMLKTLGADAVGMSTVPEVIVARHAGLRVLGISCITNLAAGISDQKLDHQEVMETANQVKSQFIALLSGFFLKLAAKQSNEPVS